MVFRTCHLVWYLEWHSFVNKMHPRSKLLEKYLFFSQFHVTFQEKRPSKINWLYWAEFRLIFLCMKILFWRKQSLFIFSEKIILLFNFHSIHMLHTCVSLAWKIEFKTYLCRGFIFCSHIWREKSWFLSKIYRYFFFT